MSFPAIGSRTSASRGWRSRKSWRTVAAAFTDAAKGPGLGTAILDNQTIELSVTIDGEGIDPAVVARDWPVARGFVSEPGA